MGKVPIIFTDAFDSCMDNFAYLERVYEKEIGNSQYVQPLLLSSVYSSICSIIYGIVSVVVNELNVHKDYYWNYKDCLSCIPMECNLITLSELQNLNEVYYAYDKYQWDIRYFFNINSIERIVHFKEAAKVIVNLFEFSMTLRQRIVNQGGPKYTSMLSFMNVPLGLWFKNLFQSGHKTKRYYFEVDPREEGSEGTIPGISSIYSYI